MAKNSRSISAILVPLSTDLKPFIAGLKEAESKGKKAHVSLSKSLDGIGVGGGKGAAQALEKAFGAAGARAALSVGKVTAGVAGLAVAAGAAAIAVTKLGRAHIAGVGKDAQGVGATAEAYSRLKGVARATGTEVGDLQELMRGLTESINSSIGKTTAQSEVFAKLGTSAEELARMPVEDQIRKLNRGFAQLPNDAAKAEAAMKLAGATGIKTFRLLAAGTQDFDKAFAEAPVVTDEEVDSVRRLEIAINKVVDRVQAFADTVTTKLLPPIQRIADLIEGFSSSLKLPSWLGGGGTPAAAPKAPVPAAVAAVTGQAPTNAAAVAQQAKETADLAGKRAEAAKAQERVAELEAKTLAQRKVVDKTRTSKLVNTRMRRNGNEYRPANYKEIDKLANLRAELGNARKDADNKANAAMSPAEAMAKAARGNTELTKATADLRNEYRQDIQSGGKDEIQRRLDQLKGLSPADRKGLEADAYRAREANKTSALRDELQESTKTPRERLNEDMRRISEMVSKGSLTQVQAVRAIAQKGAESGLVGGPTRLAGAVDRNSIEGRSARLDALYGNQSQDVLSVARQTLRENGLQTSYLGRLVNSFGNNSQPVMGY